MHPILDTIGIQLVSDRINFLPGVMVTRDLAIPSAARLASTVCSRAVLQIRGPAVLMGFVHDPDTGKPATGAKVELVYEQSDPLGLKKSNVTRSVNVDSVGNYRICGLPPDMKGKVQVFFNGVSSGEVSTSIDNTFVGLRSLSIVSAHQSVATVKTDSGKVQTVIRGSARVTGRVVNKQGQPLMGARVSVPGTASVAITRPNGDFVLDSLPSGTQSLEVRKLGYALVDTAVELSMAEPARITVKMNDYVQTLATMRVEAQADRDLSQNGYLERKQTGMGRYIDGKDLRTDAMKFSDVVRQMPNLKIVPLGNGRDYVITSAREPVTGCVNFYVDGFPFKELEPGDVDQFLRPSDVRAVEVYSGSTVPPQFTQAGQSKCEVVVVWTIRGPVRKK
jgi:hypothetical protein